MTHLGAGQFHSCAVVEQGAVRCFGRNSLGQLGDGTTTGRLSPTPVLLAPGGPPLIGALATALGYDHTCALLNGGQVRCWGNNNLGQLGDATPFDRLHPVPVVDSFQGAPLTGGVSLALGGHHSCALLSGGGVRCWGFNGWGQLGDGTGVDRRTPVSIPF